MSWSEGYRSDVNYTTGYYGEMNATSLIAPFLMANMQPPKIVNACELGFGFGLSLNIHAVAGKAKWYGTDFNPSHALFAQQLAQQGNPDKVSIVDQPFAEFCQREDLPEFDFIALHGIWSWVSPQNRDLIIDFIHRKLKVGGIVYISYNCLPGWAAKSPVHHLLHRYFDIFSSELQTPQQALSQAFEQTKALLSVSDKLLANTPLLLEQVKQIEEKRFNYVLHEYTNEYWTPMYFSEIENYLKQAKLSYVCSPSYLDDFNEVLFNEEQQNLLNGIQDPSLFQMSKDFILNKQFRRDIWVKGKLELSKNQVEKEWRKLHVLLLVPADKVSREIKNYHHTEFKEELLTPILEKVGNNKIYSVNDLCNELQDKIQPHFVCKMIALLIANKEMIVVQPKDVIDSCSEDCHKLNQYIIDNVFSENSINYLASPISGGAVYFTNIELIFLSAHKQKIKQNKWEEYAYSVLQQHEQLLLKEGSPLKTKEETLEELTRLKQEFLGSKFNLAKALAVI